MIKRYFEEGPVTILMAEDDPDDRVTLREAFGEVLRGEVQLHFVENGEELMDVLTRKWNRSDSARSPLPQLILLDLNMPRKDGREALREIKSSPELRRIPVVIWTTSTAPVDIDYCYETGASSYLIKPSGYAELVETVGTLCKYWFEQVSLPPQRA